MRIISLVPSLTELLYDLGLREEVVGITKFCIHPKAWHQNKRRVGGTKNVNLEIIHQLQPTLIIANKEENVKEQVAILAEHYPVCLTDINTCEQALDAIREIGIYTKKETAAAQLITDISNTFYTISLPERPLRVAYLIWNEPYMVAANNTFIHDMLTKAGFINVFESSERYPVTTIQVLQSMKPEVLLLSSEPYPFAQKHIDTLQHHFPGTKIILVDGEMFSWYGSRMLLAADYFTALQKTLLG